MREMGTARLAITVARRLCKKKKITNTTSTTASSSSSCTCFTEARMPVVRSDKTSTLSDAGRPACNSGSCCWIASTVAITLAPGWRCTFKMMAAVSGDSCVPAHAPSRLFSAPSTTRATSRMRTGASLR